MITDATDLVSGAGFQVFSDHLNRGTAAAGPDRVALTRALAAPPSNHRLTVVLHHLGHLSTSEIAEQQGVAEGTVRSWLSRGRSQLAEYFVTSVSAQ